MHSILLKILPELNEITMGLEKKNEFHLFSRQTEIKYNHFQVVSFTEKYN